MNDLNLYSNQDSLKINISAIVGKNGSGKSTLIELLYLANYNLGCEYELLSWIKKKGESEFSEKNFYKKKELHFTILYESDEHIYKLVFDGENIKLHKSKKISKKGVINFSSKNLFDDKAIGATNFEFLFYTIAINYSIYGLNSKNIGNWIKPLFHKNDGYRTPLVINPMRNEGNFDINDETDFSYNRILANLISKRLKQKKQGINSNIFLTDKQWVVNVEFKLKESAKIIEIKSIDKGVKGPPEDTFLVKDIIDAFFDGYSAVDLFSQKDSLPFSSNIYTYLKKKYDKIIGTYKEYKDIQNNNELTENEQRSSLLSTLLNDNSHVTFKFRQAINFLYSNFEENKKVKWQDTRTNESDNISFKFTLDELIDWMEVSDNQNITNFLPPSIFQTKIWLSTTPNSKPCTFGDLSSGEQQYINSVQTILYHLNNINSVHLSGNNEKILYKNVNIIFDEIELYFHPEYQQKYIQHLITEIKNMELNDEKGINSVNIIFCTHSPFILSDISNENILLMEVDNDSKLSMSKVSEDKTFGANIHDLLHNEFFLENGFMGAYSKEIISELITFLKHKNKTEKEIELNFNWDEDNSKKVINIIAEELIRERLEELYNAKYKTQDKQELKRRIEELQKRLNKVDDKN